MNEALTSILCAEERWSVHDYYQSVVFNADGTGELWSCLETNWFVALALSWRTLPSPDAPAQPAQPTSTPRTPHLLGHLHLEITLHRELARSVPPSMRQQHSTHLTQEVLRDEAFRAKRYSVRVERGEFIEPSAVGVEGLSGSQRYALRLVFDTSPYPPREEWREPEGGPDSNRFWERVEFVARRVEGGKGGGRAMNDVSAAGGGWGGGCLVC